MIGKIVRTICAVSALASVSSTAYAKTLEELLVEKGVITQSEAKSTIAIPSRVTYDKGIKIELPEQQFVFGINTFLQTRYTFHDGEKENTSGFDISRARIILSGSALADTFEYQLSGDFVGGTADEKKSADLRDAYLEWKAWDIGGVRVGQFKTAISRQFVNSDESLQFADRSVASDYFNLGRQQGALATAKPIDQLTLGAGIFNGISAGEGINRSAVDTKHTGVLSMRADIAGGMKWKEEGDVLFTKDAAVNAGAAYAFSDATQANGSDLTVQSVSVDLNAKRDGVSAHTELFWTRQDPDAAGSADPVGGYAQVGVMVAPRIELAGRYSLVSCDEGKGLGSCAGNDQLREATVGMNYYWWKHQLKAQLDYSHVEKSPTSDESENDTDQKVIVQLSAFF